MNRSESPQVKALKERYKQSFMDKIELLNSQLVNLNQGVDNLVEIHENLHKLAGSSGMYGYSDVSDLCRQTMGSCAGQNPGDVADGLSALIRLLEQNC